MPYGCRWGSESPPESLTRLLIIDAGLPRPRTQVVIKNGIGEFVARADLGWPDWRVAVEYDGEHHWSSRDQRSHDLDRVFYMERLGWTVVRVTAELLYDRPDELIDRITAALWSRGWRAQG